MTTPGDEDDELAQRRRTEALQLVRGIPRRREEQIEMERALIHNARREGVDWDEIAFILGLDTLHAIAQYGEPAPDDDDPR